MASPWETLTNSITSHNCFCRRFACEPATFFGVSYIFLLLTLQQQHSAGSYSLKTEMKGSWWRQQACKCFPYTTILQPIEHRQLNPPLFSVCSLCISSYLNTQLLNISEHDLQPSDLHKYPVPKNGIVAVFSSQPPLLLSSQWHSGFFSGAPGTVIAKYSLSPSWYMHFPSSMYIGTAATFP